MSFLTFSTTFVWNISHSKKNTARCDLKCILVFVYSTGNYCKILINRLTPNDQYMGRTAPLTSKRCILYIYSTNIGTEYFKHALYSPFFLFKMQFVS